MSLSKRLKEVEQEPTLYGPPCSVARLLEKLDEEDRKAVEDILSQKADGQGVSNRKLHQILISEGHVVSFFSLGSHRRKQCRCFTGLDKQV